MIVQVAYRYMECVQALSDGNLLLDEPDLDITLEDLSDCYGVEYPEELSGDLVAHNQYIVLSNYCLLHVSLLAQSCM